MLTFQLIPILKDEKEKNKSAHGFDFLKDASQYKEIEELQKRCKYLVIKKQKLLLEISLFKEKYQSKFRNILLDIDVASKELQNLYQKVYNSLDPAEQAELKREFGKFEETQQEFDDMLNDTLVQQKLTKEEEEELRYFYRKMTVLYHPDKHVNSSKEDQVRCEEKMKIIAILRKNNDLDGIKAFMEQEGLDIPPYKNKEKQDQSKKIQSLKQRIQRVEAEIQKLQLSEIYQLYQQSVLGGESFRLLEEKKLEKYKDDIEHNIALMQELGGTTLAA